ncbi:MAG TPA: host attachment protein [Chthoniobacteraceae bacterium]|nr:host attachment protein [Chthoniobacteraceae bacterium]
MHPIVYENRNLLYRYDMRPPSFIIVADRGRLVAYSVDRSVRKPTPRVADTADFAEAHQRLAEQVTDKAGSFPISGAGVHANAASERNSLLAELDTRNFRHLAGRITSLLQHHRPEAWAFAAPAEINAAILEGVHPAFRVRLTHVLPRDLIHVPPGEILNHFSHTPGRI